MRILVNLIGLVAGGATAIYLAHNRLDPQTELWLLIVGPVGTILVAIIGRWALKRWPTASGAVWVTTLVHYTFALVAGASVIAAASWAVVGSGLLLPLPIWVCDVSAAVLGVPGLVLSLAAVVNLAIKGLGAPFAVALTRRLASDWLYACTRNPMMLGTFLLILGLGFAWRSGLFLLWSVVGFIPAVVILLKLFEERELALRFGESYLAYKARTPFMFPRLRA